MLIEIWEKLRGYDKWAEAEATVALSKVKTYSHRGGGKYFTSRDVLKFTDGYGKAQRISFTVPDDSPLFQIVSGSKVKILYNPSKPDQYYLRELLQTRVRKVVRAIYVVILMIGAILFFAWLQSWARR